MKISVLAKWLVFWLGQTLGMVLIGALLGIVFFPLVGLAFGAPYSAADLMMHGAYNLGFYALIWAPGLSFILCVMRSHRKHHELRN